MKRTIVHEKARTNKHNLSFQNTLSFETQVISADTKDDFHSLPPEQVQCPADKVKADQTHARSVQVQASGPEAPQAPGGDTGQAGTHSSRGSQHMW